MRASQKRSLILEAAIRRFSHFGLAKTTMAEIAQDLSFSKALLYYYYPDKHSLYIAALSHVIEQTMADFYVQLGSVKALKDIKESVLFFLDRRMEFVRNNFSFLQQSMDAVRQIPAKMTEVMEDSRTQQQNLFAAILQEGVDRNLLKPMDVSEIAGLLLLTIEGVRLGSLKAFDGPVFPTEADFDKILELQKKLVSILIDGLLIRG